MSGLVCSTRVLVSGLVYMCTGFTGRIGHCTSDICVISDRRRHHFFVFTRFTVYTFFILLLVCFYFITHSVKSMTSLTPPL